MRESGDVLPVCGRGLVRAIRPVFVAFAFQGACRDKTAEGPRPFLLPVQFVQQLEPGERQVVVNSLDGRGVTGDVVGQASGGDNP
jgi:hypothetical protein